MSTSPAQIHLETRNRTILELSPQLSRECMLVNAAAGQSQDGYTTLTMSDDTAELLAQILIRYNSSAQQQRGGGYPTSTMLRVEDDHDTAFWDQVACDLLVAREIPPPAGATALVYSIGKTADR